MQHPSRPKRKWHERNFLTRVMLPTLFAKPQGTHRPPRFPKLKGNDLSITFIGHASFLIQTPGHNILIDPCYANWIVGQKRIRRPGLALKDLPPIDMVLITHAHFDHLHIPTLKKVAKGQTLVLPYNVADVISGCRFGQIIEMNHWETLPVNGLKITFVPAAHWGARTLTDRHRGYGGYIIEYNGRSVYHCGDSTYFKGFKEIGERCAPEIALLPIGAYDPPSGRDHHMGPEEAVLAFEDLKAKWFIPMHYGSFRLSYEPVTEPLERLLKASLKHAIASRVRILDEGKPERF
ncbi:MAG: MBL fold metallo-hydrolase [Verrucomicrobiae bacterium]|nr:MBL fold metallo-hydrolase [Verrucomicrobiae bacterium]